MTMSTDARIERLRRTPDDLAAAIRGQPERLLVCRPAAGAWSVTEVICHLRDVEECYLERVRFILANHEPTLMPFDPDRWAEERQYQRQHIALAHGAFHVRRAETMDLLGSLSPEQWERAGLHPLRGRMTVRRIVHGWAKHDDGHLDQIRRALAGLP